MTTAVLSVDQMWKVAHNHRNYSRGVSEAVSTKCPCVRRVAGVEGEHVLSNVKVTGGRAEKQKTFRRFIWVRSGFCNVINMPISVVVGSKTRVCCRSLAVIVDSNPAGAWLAVSCESCVLSGRGLCVGLITRPEESYLVLCVWVWSWNTDNEEVLAPEGLLRLGKNTIKFTWSIRQST